MPRNTFKRIIVGAVLVTGASAAGLGIAGAANAADGGETTPHHAVLSTTNGDDGSTTTLQAVPGAKLDASQAIPGEAIPVPGGVVPRPSSGQEDITTSK
jgi:hypothetical protein